MSRFDYVKYDEKALKDQAELKEAFINVETLVEKLIAGGRYKALVLTALEEAYAWCGKGIRDECVARTGLDGRVLQEERGNE